ncbi:tetratricopeptide repeat protein [Ktedonobacteria bacterium brp13]|nr:tetratricopeptide repeat protein [Ktedonobacteria bacterium brp13]
MEEPQRDFENLIEDNIIEFDEPSVSPRAQTLPLTSLNWKTFEQLCCRIVAVEPGIDDLPHLYGVPGDDQKGIDIIAKKKTDHRLETWCFQCKDHKKFSPKQFKTAISDLEFPADTYVFFLASEANTRLRDIEEENSNVKLWDLLDISTKLKKHPDIVADFFNPSWVEYFCIPDVPIKIYQVPYQSNPFFTGREDILEELHNRLNKNKAVALSQAQAITGLGGIGKTQIALEYVRRYSNEYVYIFWVEADTTEALTANFISIANSLNILDFKKQEKDQLIKTLFDWFNNHNNWLIVYDNVEDFSEIKKFTPPKQNGHIIMTTRDHSTSGNAYRVEVGNLSIDEGILFLLRRSGFIDNSTLLDDISYETRTEAAAVVQALSSFPLAIDQAGAYIEETSCGLYGYLERFQNHRFKLLMRRGKSPTYHPEPVTTTFSLSFERVAQLNSQAATLLKFYAFFASDPIPEEIITNAKSKLDHSLKSLVDDIFNLDEAFNALLSYSLIRRNSHLKTITIHRLVQEVLKESMDLGTQKQWIENILSVLNEVFPHSNNDNWQTCQRYVPHVQIILEQIKDWEIVPPEAIFLSLKTGKYFLDFYQFTEAESMYNYGIEKIKNKNFNRHDIDGKTIDYILVEVYREFAKMMFIKGELKKAEEILNNALEINIKEFGMETPLSAIIMSDLAQIYQDRGDYENAGKYLNIFEEIISNTERFFNYEILDAFLNAGRFYWSTGQFDMAENIFKNAINGAEHYLGQEHFQFAQVLDTVAEFYRDQGKFDLAEQLYNKVILIFQKNLEPDHPRFASTMNNLGLLYFNQKKYELAQPLLEDAYSRTRRIYGSTNLNTAIGMNNLALLYRDQGKYGEAIALLSEVFEIQSTIYDNSHPDLANTINNLGGVYFLANELDIAEYFFEYALEIFNQVLKPNHPDIANVLVNLAGLHNSRGEYEKAEGLLIDALNICRDAFGSNSATVAQHISSLAFIYDRQSKYEKAVPLYEEAIEIYEKVLGPQHPNLLLPLNNLGLIYIRYEKYDQAEAVFDRLLSQYKSLDLDILAQIKGNHAFAYFEQAKYDLAEKGLLETIEILLKLSHLTDDGIEQLLAYYTKLSEIYILKKQYGEAEYLLLKVINIEKSRSNVDQGNLVVVLSNLGFIYELQRKYKLSEEYYKKSLAIAASVYSEGHLYLEVVKERYNNIKSKTEGNSTSVQSVNEKNHKSYLKVNRKISRKSKKNNRRKR